MGKIEEKVNTKIYVLSLRQEMVFQSYHTVYIRNRKNSSEEYWNILSQNNYVLPIYTVSDDGNLLYSGCNTIKAENYATIVWYVSEELGKAGGVICSPTWRQTYNFIMQMTSASDFRRNSPLRWVENLPDAADRSNGRLFGYW